MEITKDQERVKKTLRLPRDLSVEVDQEAEARGTSANEVIVDRLRSAPLAGEVARLSGEIAEIKAMIRQLIASIG
jgi:hypothetical protein